ncbi:hypothetical protein DID88_004409 [Monilinia fructigena]|uniref:Uncharacterized protein n=1 Tax=Monilinia fructigena TaxID=38457 RepID=A0A395IW40_9HELO|nr:hypothetical protein DID88_004409 [Monilinia fructigena]
MMSECCPCLLNIEPEISRSSHLFISSQLNSTQLNHPLQNSPHIPEIQSIKHIFSLAHRTLLKRQLTNTSHRSPYF